MTTSKDNTLRHDRHWNHVAAAGAAFDGAWGWLRETMVAAVLDAGLTVEDCVQASGQDEAFVRQLLGEPF